MYGKEAPAPLISKGFKEEVFFAVTNSVKYKNGKQQEMMKK